VKLLAAGAITSAELANALSNETGTGAVVFGTNPTITGATISGGSINNTPIGASTANTGAFTTLTTTSTINLITVGRGAGNVSSNTAIGANTLATNTTGIANTALGSNSLFSNLTGNSNVAIGANALLSNVSTDNNVAVGTSALRLNSTGANNAALGGEALRGNIRGSGNLAMGFNALRSNSGGSTNVAIGNAAGYNTTVADSLIGDNNIIIGTSAATSIKGDADGNLVIGNSVQLPIADGDDQVVIKNIIFATNASGAGTTIVGSVGIGTNAPAYRLDVNGNFRADSIFTDIAGNAVFSTSDARLKKNIEPVPAMLQKITALNPVTYEWNDLKIDQAINRENTAHLYGKKIGLIAQEVYEVFPDFVGTDADGNMVLSYGAFIVPMLKAIQEQQAQIEQLKQRITQLENK
jgi:hypothetical protein